MKHTIIQTGDTFTVCDAAGDLIAMATFACPRSPADCDAVMRERAAWLRRWA